MGFDFGVYVAIGLGVLALLMLAGLLIYKFFIKSDTLVVSSAKTEIKAATDIADAGKAAAVEVKNSVTELKGVISDSETKIAAAISSADVSKTKIQKAATKEISEYLKSEGYYVEEIFPED